jgi:hypothetical protein
MTVGTYRVSTPEFRKALDAVRRHADKTKTGGDGTQALRRVRLYFDPAAGYVRVMATCIATSAVAVAPLLRSDGGQMDLLDAGMSSDDGKTGPAVADILPQHAARILGAFPAKGDDGMAMLQLDVEDGALTATDVGGLMDGDAYVMTAPPDAEGFPDVWGIVHRALLDAQKTPSPKPLTAPGQAQARFLPASKLYETPLTTVPSGSADSRAFVVECGPSFLGLISSGHDDDDSLSKRARARQLWLDRFAGKRLQEA